MDDFKNITEENLPSEHLCCIIRAKELPCVFNNWGVFYKGKFVTVNLLDLAYLKRILSK